MAQRKRKSTRQDTKPRTPKDEAANQPIDGILVAVAGDSRKIQVLGETKVTEAPTLLRQAAKDVERELRID